MPRGHSSDLTGDTSGQQLGLEAAFGLRREEALKFRPAVSIRGDRLALVPSTTKGGRFREIEITHPAQLEVLDEVTALAGSGSLIPAGTTYREYLNRYKHQTRAAGDEAALGADRRFGQMHEVLHRVGIVDMHIAARAWCAAAGVELDGFTSDFEPGSRGRHKATTIEGKGKGWRFTPDALAWVRLPGQDRQRLLILELERGGEAGDLSPFMRDKLPHLQTLAEGKYVEKRLALPDLAPFLIVFGSAAMRDRALDRWPEPAAEVWGRFFIKSQDELAEDFGGGWHQPGDRPPRPLFKLA